MYCKRCGGAGARFKGSAGQMDGLRVDKFYRDLSPTENHVKLKVLPSPGLHSEGPELFCSLCKMHFKSAFHETTKSGRSCTHRSWALFPSSGRRRRECHERCRGGNSKRVGRTFTHRSPVDSGSGTRGRELDVAPKGKRTGRRASLSAMAIFHQLRRLLGGSINSGWPNILDQHTSAW